MEFADDDSSILTTLIIKGREGGWICRFHKREGGSILDVATDKSNLLGLAMMVH